MPLAHPIRDGNCYHGGMNIAPYEKPRETDRSGIAAAVGFLLLFVSFLSALILPLVQETAVWWSSFPMFGMMLAVLILFLVKVFAAGGKTSK